MPPPEDLATELADTDTDPPLVELARSVSDGTFRFGSTVQTMAQSPQNSLWLLGALAAGLTLGCIRERRWPDTDDVIELAAYAGGIWGGVQLLVHAVFVSEGVDVAVATGCSAAVVMLALRGAWKVLNKYLKVGDASLKVNAPAAGSSPPPPPV